MYKIGVLSKRDAFLSSTQAELKKSHFFDVSIYTDTFEFVRTMKDNSLDAFVILTDEFKDNHYDIIKQIKKHFPMVPLIVCAREFTSQHKLKLFDFKKTILLNSKYELKDLNGILIKLINNMHVIPRLASRYQTLQMARVKLEQEKIYSAWILNLAQDGACFRVFNRCLRAGDSIRIEVPIAKYNKTHVIQGRVIWQKVEKLKDNVVANSQVVGIQFVS